MLGRESQFPSVLRMRLHTQKFDKSNRQPQEEGDREAARYPAVQAAKMPVVSRAEDRSQLSFFSRALRLLPPAITNERLPTAVRIGHYTGAQGSSKGSKGHREKSVRGNKIRDAAVFLFHNGRDTIRPAPVKLDSSSHAVQTHSGRGLGGLSGSLR